MSKALRLALHLLAAGFLLAAAPRALAQAGEAPRLEAQELGAGLHLLSGPPHGNVLLSSGLDGALLVDASDSALAGQLLEMVRRVAGGPPRLVVNTHYHFDHIGGNAAARQAGALTLAHAAVPAQARASRRVEELDWTLVPAPEAAVPVAVIADSMALRINGEEVRIFHLPAAHTDGDLAVHFRGANVLHAGDVVELGAWPFVDLWAGGSTEGMIAAVDALLARADGETRVVPGHGPVTDREGLLAYREMLVTVRERVRDEIAAGADVQAAMDADVTAGFEDGRWGTARQGRRFAGLVFLDLTGGVEPPARP